MNGWVWCACLLADPALRQLRPRRGRRVWAPRDEAFARSLVFKTRSAVHAASPNSHGTILAWFGDVARSTARSRCAPLYQALHALGREDVLRGCEMGGTQRDLAVYLYARASRSPALLALQPPDVSSYTHWRRSSTTQSTCRQSRGSMTDRPARVDVLHVETKAVPRTGLN